MRWACRMPCMFRQILQGLLCLCCGVFRRPEILACIAFLAVVWYCCPVESVCMYPQQMTVIAPFSCSIFVFFFQNCKDRNHFCLCFCILKFFGLVVVCIPDKSLQDNVRICQKRVSWRDVLLCVPLLTIYAVKPRQVKKVTCYKSRMQCVF